MALRRQARLDPKWLLDLWERDKLVTLLLELATDRVAQDIANPTATAHAPADRPLFRAPCRCRRCGAPCRPTCGQPTASFFGAGLGPGLPGANRRQPQHARAVICLLHEAYAGRLRRAKRGAQPSFERFGSRRTVRDSGRRPAAHPGAFRRAGPRRASRRLPLRGQAARPPRNLPAARLGLVAGADPCGTDTGVINPAAFAADPLLTPIDAASYADHWDCYTDSLWTLEVRDERQVAVLRHTDSAAFLRTLFNLLSSHPKWPIVKSSSRRIRTKRAALHPATGRKKQTCILSHEAQA